FTVMRIRILSFRVTSINNILKNLFRILVWIGGIIIMVVVNSCSDRDVRITVNVFVPVSTPKDAQLFIAGNHRNAGDWNPGQIKLERKSDLHWSVTLLIPKGFFFEFKITRGTWDNQAIFTEGEISPNYQIIVVSDTSIELKPVSWYDIGFAFTKNIIGTVKYHRQLEGDGLNYPRDLIVWLPPSYEIDTSRCYPVLYMHDGQNIIDPATSFIGYDWRIDEVADSLIRSRKMKEIIIVGIYNTPDRSDEYDDTKLGKAYMKFIIEKIKPFIDSTYRTLPERENTAVMGSSLGGLISFLLSWNYPQVFSQAGCVSPVFRSGLIRSINEYVGSNKDIRIYIDNGGVGMETELQPGCDMMLVALKNIGFRVGDNLLWFYDEYGEHNERAWSKRLWIPLLFMYGK
ncbi:MAG: alpha/beta hydrolase-fold protein, partial [Bacteroidota bacterium]|nr:alpha/beta hydrolase-fold protein [Bacteroidota bacterium]